MSRESEQRLTLVIGNKNYASWSLRPWLAMKHTGIPFVEQHYVDTLIALPAMQLWHADARAEREAVEEYDRMYS